MMKLSRKTHYILNPKGFTLMEVVIAALIFSLGIAGLLTSIAQMRAPAVESSEEVTAAFVGKQVLEDLRSQVNAQSWSDSASPLEPGSHTGTTSVSGRNYAWTYLVEDDPAGTNSRKVTLNVTW